MLCFLDKTIKKQFYKHAFPCCEEATQPLIDPQHKSDRMHHLVGVFSADAFPPLPGRWNREASAGSC